MRDGLVIIPDVPLSGLYAGHIGFLRAVKEALEVLQGTHSNAAPERQAARQSDLAAIPLFYQRGDVAAYDFTASNFTQDGNWHDLDLSAIVPVGASRVRMRVLITDETTNAWFQVRQNGNSNNYILESVRTQAVSVPKDGILECPLDGNRIIEYRAAAVTFITLSLVVVGWWKP